jgi:hypothetical protein
VELVRSSVLSIRSRVPKFWTSIIRHTRRQHTRPHSVELPRASLPFATHHVALIGPTKREKALKKRHRETQQCLILRPKPHTRMRPTSQRTQHILPRHDITKRNPKPSAATFTPQCSRTSPTQKTPPQPPKPEETKDGQTARQYVASTTYHITFINICNRRQNLQTTNPPPRNPDPLLLLIVSQDPLHNPHITLHPSRETDPQAIE